MKKRRAISPAAKKFGVVSKDRIWDAIYLWRNTPPGRESRAAARKVNQEIEAYGRRRIIETAKRERAEPSA